MTVLVVAAAIYPIKQQSELTHLALFTDNTCIYATENRECLAICKLQCGCPVVCELEHKDQ
jgi:hypothetical protein